MDKRVSSPIVIRPGYLLIVDSVTDAHSNDVPVKLKSNTDESFVQLNCKYPTAPEKEKFQYDPDAAIGRNHG